MRISDWSSDVCSSDLLQPTFAVTGILKSLGMSDSGKKELAEYIRTHHPQYGVNKEAGGSGADVRSLVYMQMQALSWLNEDHWRNESNGPDADNRTSNGLSDFRKQVAGWKTQAGNIAHYEKQGYPVLMQEMMTPLCRELAGLPQDETLLPYLLSRRRPNGSFNNAPARDGGDGNVLHTYWSLLAFRLYKDKDPLREPTIQWLQACQRESGGFTHQPNPVIGGNDAVEIGRAHV